MNKYINAENFKDWYAKNIIHDEAFNNLIDMQPAADVRENIHGKWNYIAFLTRECSVCKTQFHELEEDNFCPHCGAIMDLKEKHERKD